MKCEECGHELAEHNPVRDIIGCTIVKCNKGMRQVKKCLRMNMPHNHRPCKCRDELWDTLYYVNCKNCGKRITNPNTTHCIDCAYKDLDEGLKKLGITPEDYTPEIQRVYDYMRRKKQKKFEP